MASKSVNRGEDPAAENDKALAREAADQNDEVAGSLVDRATKLGLRLPGKNGDEAAMMDYIMGEEPHGQFPLGWYPTDRAAVRAAQEGTGPGEVEEYTDPNEDKDEDVKDNGKQGY